VSKFSLKFLYRADSSRLYYKHIMIVMSENML